MTFSDGMLLRDARLNGTGSRFDVLIRDGRVAGIAPAGTAGAPDAEEVDLAGRTALPGLWDSHVHFDQWSLSSRRLDLSTAASAAEAATAIARKVSEDGAAAGDEVFLAHGFRDALWPDLPTAALLDEQVPNRPVVSVSSDLHCGWLNSAALRRFGLADHPTGILREREFMFLMNDLDEASSASRDAWSLEAAERAAARGVVGIVDYEIADNLAVWQHRIRSGFDRLRVAAGVWPEWLDSVIEQGWRTGDVIPETGGLLTLGSLKVITDGSLNTRTAYCHDPYPGMEGRPDGHGVLAVGPEELLPLMAKATGNGLRVAIHAIGDRANGLVVSAFAETGAAGTIEHAQLVAAEDFSRFAEFGIVASVQPRHALDDWEVADRYWAGRLDRAFAYRTLLDSGAELLLGSDAPVAPLDPWITLAAAVSRELPGAPAWHPEQEIPLESAIAASAGGRSRIGVGDVADIAIAESSPWESSARDLEEMPIFGTLVAGRWTHRSDR